MVDIHGKCFYHTETSSREPESKVENAKTYLGPRQTSVV